MGGEWWEAIGPEVTIEHEGKVIPITDHPNLRESKSLGDFSKQALQAHKEVGSRVRLPGPDAKPEDLQAFRGKLKETGHFEFAPDGPDKYTILKPDMLPPRVEWLDEKVAKFREVAHRLGITQKQAEGLLAFDMEIETARGARLQLNVDDGVKYLKEKWGDSYEAKAELAKDAVKSMCTDEQMAALTASGFDSNPVLMQFFAKVGEKFQEDSSLGIEMFHPQLKGVKEEIEAIEHDASNEDHKKLVGADPVAAKQVVEKLSLLYAKLYPGDAKSTRSAYL